MCDFQAFRNQARAAFPDLNISVMMYEKQTAKGSDLIYYRLSAAGMSIGPQRLTAEATSAEDAIAALVRQVAPARRAVRAAVQQAQLTRHQRQAA